VSLFPKNEVLHDAVTVIYQVPVVEFEALAQKHGFDFLGDVFVHIDFDQDALETRIFESPFGSRHNPVFDTVHIHLDM
jgi:hypothetical protein